MKKLLVLLVTATPTLAFAYPPPGIWPSCSVAVPGETTGIALVAFAAAIVAGVLAVRGGRRKP